MALQIDDAETESLVRQLAEMKRVEPDEAVKLAVENELKRAPLYDRIQPIRDRIKAAGRTGLRADKEFFDELSGE